MPIIEGHTIDIKDANQAIYNGFDDCLTLNVDDARIALRANDTLLYDFERGMQAPALNMMRRGFRVDIHEREKAVIEITEKKQNVEKILFAIMGAIFPDATEKLPNSPKQLQTLFYDIMKMEPIERFENGEFRRPMNRETLERLELRSPYAGPIVRSILLDRDLTKALQVLETEIDSDWRWRCSYNIGGTSTGRWSSSKSPVGTGNNFQNIGEEFRRVFIPDPGYKLYGIDKAQSEAHDVAWFCGTILGDWSYLDACRSGDLHTFVTRMLYPNWNWTGNLKKDREIANRLFYRSFTYRDASKRLAHACLTEDHEVLTKTGWVSIKDKPTEILQWEQGRSKFVKVSNWIDAKYTGTLHEFGGKNISIQMTENHRIPYTPDRRYRVRECLASAGPQKLMPLGDGYIGGSEIVPARLIAAFMSDGRQSSANTLDFQFTKIRKASRLVELCSIYGIEVQEGNSSRDGVMRFYVKVGSLPKKAGAFMLNWTLECIEDFLDEYQFWDGSYKVESQQTVLYSIDKEHLDWIKTLGRICGVGGTLWSAVPKGSFTGNTKLYYLSQNKRLFTTGKGTTWNKTVVNSIRVLCPTVESGFFYVRRNGKISVTGNSNYYGRPKEISRQTRIPQHLCEEFQDRYFDAFPCIRRMHEWVAQKLQRDKFLVNSFGRRRDFFDPPTIEDTLKSAIAYMFQSATGDCLNLGLYRLWKKMGHEEVELLSQLHDAIYFQMRERNEKEEMDLLLQVIDCVEVTQKFGDRTMKIPGEIVAGYNWAHRFRYENDKLVEWNPQGLSGVKLN